MWKFEEQFRKDNPQTIGETDKHFDLDNYKDWLELKLSLYMDTTAQHKWACPKCGELVDGRCV